MTTAQASSAGWITADPSGCNAGWQIARYPKSLYAGVWEDTVKVVATTSRSFSTRKGLRVGDPVRRLLAMYPTAKVVSRNIYDEAPIYGVRGKRLYFTARKSKVVMIEVAHDFLPNGTEFEC